jgi:hypothetical protein
MSERMYEGVVAMSYFHFMALKQRFSLFGWLRMISFSEIHERVYDLTEILLSHRR